MRKSLTSPDMKNTAPFNDVLEAAGQLTLEEQQDLVQILNRRLVDLRRSELAKDIQTAQREFQSGSCQPATPDQLIKEISS